MYLIAKSVSKWYPELFLIISVVVYWLFTATLVNPIAISLLMLLVVELRVKSKLLGIFLAIAFLLLGLYTVVVFVQEMLQVENLFQTIKMLVFEVLYFGFTFCFAMFLLFKSLAKTNERIPLGDD